MGSNGQSQGRLVLRKPTRFNGVKVFSATVVNVREMLGEAVTAWIAENPRLELTEIVVTQSSDARFHCVAISVFFWDGRAATTSKMPALPKAIHAS
jgi:hypothetical protein